ncbi:MULTISPECIES: pyridoxal phosphate-dependent aminotransferase [Clostridium]|uniref:Aminotransferase n=1 Tax=Clostridium colicanis DSM 13634 TaxID=1121305 RepID=A0A151AM67_9CLOT|nr:MULTISPECIES: pyridoxal phosphate-dependent aminotransferase [Clostridium]KYH28729.1 aspartate aminotransferase [Clostridium colicanis DSM 13634]MBE6044943.1 pyridoxal phosphate-dependent aminotransferase [Clostridium thermopalmarium]
MKSRFLGKKYLNDNSNPLSSAASLLGDKDIINLSIGDPDFITDSIITNAAFKDALNGHTKYTKPSGDPELIKEITKFYKDDYNIDVKENEVMVTVGACHAMYLALKSIIDEGDEVIVPEPYFTPYKDQIEDVGGKIVTLVTKEDEGFNINISRLKLLINERTKAIIINSPNNPTGACYDRETLEALAKVAIENNLVIISDEVYDAIMFNDKKHTSILSMEGMKERSVLLGSFSKGYAMTGWRVGFAIAPDYVIDCMVQINESVTFSAPSISQRAAIYALRNRNKVQPAIVKGFEERMIYTANKINEIKGMKVLDPKGGIYLFANIKGTGMTSEEFCKVLLEKAKVVVVSGTAFGKSGEGFVRIACTVNIEKLEEALNRMKNLFNV